jgi:hypothetical protein
MLKKQTNFDSWVKEVTATWKHVDSLKGKQAKRNLGVLRILLESNCTLSMWELSLEYLKLTQPDFNSWTRDRVFHERQKENAQMSRRLKFLVEKQYVRKEESQYRPSFKALFLIMLLDPQMLADWKLNYYEPDIEEDLGEDMNKFGVPEDWSSNEDFKNHMKGLTSIFKDPAQGAALSAFFKRRLYGWKVNLDEISTKELIGLLMSQYDKHLPVNRKR